MKVLITSLALTLSALAGHAQAHGDATQAKKQAVAPHKAAQQTFGIAGDPKKVARSIVFDMSDEMRFDPSRIKVRRGETLRFVANNRGRIMHEMVLGTMKDLEEHAALMKKFPGMEHDEPHMTHVPPGETGEIVWRFNRPGVFNFACLIAGHMEAGMVGTITVE
ncbi:MAG: cupredoxin family protein [Rhodocyclales bacterium]|nr:cupredoxin family protein [Rhodocyclales bacterium]